MHSVDDFLYKKPSEIQAVFVSDLHLSADTPRLTQAFIKLIQHLQQLPNLSELYLLGDWLDGWLGDDDYLDTADKTTHWLHPVITALQKLKGVQIFVMHGNRDFAISQKLCNSFNGVLLDEPFFLKTPTARIRLEHGDALCTDDVAYQRYRAIIRNPIVKFLLLNMPLSFRQKLANNIKTQATTQKHSKSTTIMDVNDQAVQTALHDCDILLHGHTHRPASHQYGQKTRMVLGDWQDQTYQHNRCVHAVIALLVNQKLHLAKLSEK